jgi:tetratricopeptide (TPR) repeat protein
MSASRWQLGQHEHAVETGEAARAIALDLCDEDIVVQTNSRLSYAYCALGAYRQAIEYASATIAALHGERLYQHFGGTGFPAADTRSRSAICRAELGDFVTAEQLGTDAMHLSETDGQPFSVSCACWALGIVHLAQGEFDQAIPILERGLELCRTWEIAAHFVPIAACLGAAYARTRHVMEGIRLLEEAVGRGEAMNLMAEHPRRLAWLGEVYLLAGRREDAAAAAGRALMGSREHKEKGNEAWTLCLLGEIAAHADQPEVEQAESRYHQALTLADELGMRPLTAHCHLGLGTLYQNIGRDGQAQAELTAAAEMCRALGMCFWLNRAESALAQVVG